MIEAKDGFRMKRKQLAPLGNGDVEIGPSALGPGHGDVGDAVRVTDVSVTYNAGSDRARSVFDGLSLTIARGSFVTVVGPSGCGKTTLLMLLAGLLTPSGGRVEVGGMQLEGPRPGTTSIVFQESTLLMWRSNIRNVALPLEVAGVGKKERLARAMDALALVGMAEHAERLPSELSGGMKQRIAIARGIVTSPSLLLMDEPFAALDEQSRYVMGAQLLSLWDRLKTTVVFITHSLSEALFLADEVIALGGAGVLRETLKVPFGRPRGLELMETAEFGRIRGRLYQMLRDDWEQTL